MSLQAQHVTRELTAAVGFKMTPGRYIHLRKSHTMHRYLPMGHTLRRSHQEPRFSVRVNMADVSGCRQLIRLVESRSPDCVPLFGFQKPRRGSFTPVHRRGAVKFVEEGRECRGGQHLVGRK